MWTTKKGPNVEAISSNAGELMVVCDRYLALQLTGNAFSPKEVKSKVDELMDVIDEAIS